MTTLNIAPLLSADELGWDRDDWVDHYQDGCEDTYSSSVIWASDDSCLLATADLERLLRHHGADIEELRAELGGLINANHTVLDLRHAGQALRFLGY
jgi:hypothetical protein